MQQIRVLQRWVGREPDGRYAAEVTDLPGAFGYGPDAAQALTAAQAVALRAIAATLEAQATVLEQVCFRFPDPNA